ncbi:hypothetical protein FHX81_2353 [Saccharothrix saharensis]|uniref:Uncharacterized protein n=1 Tax=Saccharothrix saharensis TaxID=571190 RepID=A0A543JB17_9PSEU|nr:DUF6319 family protein [Saccharothrix saharensis]TQM80030.1 hypothetical protein FHX81_2353 [Saccharothrix saharensis]
MQADTLVEQEETVDAEAPAAPVQQEVAPVAQAEQPSKAEATEPEAKPADVETRSADAEAKPAKRPKSTAKKTRTVELTLTVTGTADGEWQADLVHGTKRVVQGLPISAAAVSRAAKELHDDIAGGIDEVIEAARAQHRTRMEELEAELAKVKAALAELSD